MVEALLTIALLVLVVWVLLDDYSHFKITVIEAVVTLVTVSLAGWVIILSSENFSLSTIEYGDLLIALGATFVIIRFIRKHVSMSRQGLRTRRYRPIGKWFKVFRRTGLIQD